jgi:hypothetical protein
LFKNHSPTEIPAWKGQTILPGASHTFLIDEEGNLSLRGMIFIHGIIHPPVSLANNPKLVVEKKINPTLKVLETASEARPFY